MVGDQNNMKQNIPTKKIYRQGSQCKTCGHLRLSHFASCFARKCECKEFVNKEEIKESRRNIIC